MPRRNRCSYQFYSRNGGRVRIRVREGDDLRGIADAHRRVYGLSRSQSEKLMRTLVLTRTRIQSGLVAGGGSSSGGGGGGFRRGGGGGLSTGLCDKAKGLFSTSMSVEDFM